VYSQQDTGPVAPSAPHRAASPPYPTPSHSPIPPPVDPARPPTVSKHAANVLEQSLCDRDHPEAERSCPPPVYARHTPHRDPATSATHISTVSCPIDPILRSVDVSPLFYPENYQSCELDQRNFVSEPSFIVSPYDQSTSRVAPVSLPIPLPRCTDDRHHRSYRPSHPMHSADCRHRCNDPISFVAPPPGITTRSAPTSQPIITPTRTNHVVDQSHPSSHSACELDHEEATFEPYSVVAPRVPVTSSPTTHAAIYAIPSRRECTPDVMVESLAPLAAARSISKEI